MESYTYTPKQEKLYDDYVEGGTMNPDDARRLLGVTSQEPESPSDWINDLVNALPVDGGGPVDDWAPTDVLERLPKGPVAPDAHTVQYKD